MNLIANYDFFFKTTFSYQILGLKMSQYMCKLRLLLVKLQLFFLDLSSKVIVIASKYPYMDIWEFKDKLGNICFISHNEEIKYYRMFG